MVDAAIATLSKLAEKPEEKALLSKIQEARTIYSKAFIKAAELIEADDREQATAVMTNETFPRAGNAAATHLGHAGTAKERHR